MDVKQVMGILLIITPNKGLKNMIKNDLSTELSTGKSRKTVFFRDLKYCFLNKKVSYPQAFFYGVKFTPQLWCKFYTLNNKKNKEFFEKMRACAGVRLCVRVCACVKGGKG